MIGQGYDNKWDLISNTKYTILKVKDIKYEKLQFQNIRLKRRRP